MPGAHLERGPVSLLRNCFGRSRRESGADTSSSRVIFRMGNSHSRHRRAGLGGRMSEVESRVSLVRPFLPRFLSQARIMNLPVGGGSVDLLVVRHEHDVAVNVLRRKGVIDVVVLM